MYVDEINVVAILEIDGGGSLRYGFLESRDFNLAYWRGETESAEHEVVVDAPACPAGIGPNLVEPTHESFVAGPIVQFTWPAEALRKYELWVSVDGSAATRAHSMTAPRNQIAKTKTYIGGRRVAWWVTEETPGSGCPAKRSSIYFFDLDGAGSERRRPARR